MPFPSAFMELATASVSSLAISHSASSVRKLRKYEDRAERAAEWSNTAEQRLWDTRFTVATGVVAALVSIIYALDLLLLAPSTWFRTILAAALALLEHAASRYMFSFWGSKAKVPLMDDYNDAISDSKNVIGLLDVAAVGWATITILRLLGL